MGSTGCADGSVKTLLVLHGFNSAGDTEKARFLRRHLPDVRVLSPTYSHDPNAAVASLSGTIQALLTEGRPPALLGTSLGAYYVRHLGRRHERPVILINPTLDPESTLRPAVGENRNFKTGRSYQFTASHLAALRQYKCDETQPDPPALVLLDMGDELLDSATTANRFQGRPGTRVVCFEGGNHRFAHIGEAVPEILAHLSRHA